MKQEPCELLPDRELLMINSQTYLGCLLLGRWCVPSRIYNSRNESDLSLGEREDR